MLNRGIWLFCRRNEDGFIHIHDLRFYYLKLSLESLLDKG